MAHLAFAVLFEICFLMSLYLILSENWIRLSEMPTVQVAISSEDCSESVALFLRGSLITLYQVHTISFLLIVPLSLDSPLFPNPGILIGSNHFLQDTKCSKFEYLPKTAHFIGIEAYKLLN